MDFDLDSRPCSPTPRTPSPFLLESSSGTKNDETEEPERPLPPPSPDSCSICLGNLVNKSYSNSCIHQFCFGCLLEWSKVKPECPLCKTGFRSIFHNIRNNADYDEYVVPTPTPPTPIPSLSIRVSSGGSDRSPELLITRGNHDYSLPNYSHYQRSRDPRIYRFQLAQFGASRNDSIDVMLHGHHGVHGHHGGGYGHGLPTASSAVFQENPFQDDPPEFFGGVLELATRAQQQHHHPAQRFSGYQSRRRRYDRNQWVRPFDSTLIPGTVFFPSVEYFQRHPSAIRRISSWLHRELTVLMSLTSSRSQMAFAYDLVISLLLRYDIRSSDFRDLTRPYLGPKTRHFQHEFYHYVLSGMRMEEFDGVAQYSAAQTPGTGSSSASSSRTLENPYNIPPAVVVLDSDDGDDDIVIDEVVVAAPGRGDSLANSSSSSNTQTRGRHSSSRRDRDQSRSTRSRRDRNGDNYTATATSSCRVLLDDSLNFPPVDVSRPLGRAEVENAFNEIEIELERLRNERSNSRSSNGSSSRRGLDPEMPFLEPQVNLNDLSSSSTAAGYSGSAFRRVRENDNSSTRTPPTPPLDFLSLNDMELNNLFEERPGRGFLDPEDGRRYPRLSHDSLMDFTTQREREIRGGRPLASPDFPILALRENIERRTRSRQRQHQTDQWATAAAMERPSCIYNNNAAVAPAANSSSVQIRIFPPAMDLSSPLGLNLSSNSRSHHSSGGGYSRPRTPGRPPSPTVHVADDGECEFLGVHPIIKKPPLAVITLGSEDEEESVEQSRNNDSTPLQQAPTVNTTATPYQSPTAGTSSQLLSFALPPKRRYGAALSPALGIDQVQAALSSLPSANLMERHLESIPLVRKRQHSSTSTKRALREEEPETEELSNATNFKNPSHTKSKDKRTLTTDQTSSNWVTGKPSFLTATSSKDGRKMAEKKKLPGGSKRWDLILSNSLSFSHSVDSDIDLLNGSSSDSDLDCPLQSKKPKKKVSKAKKSKKSKSSKPKSKTSKDKAKKKDKGVKESKSRGKQTSSLSTRSSYKTSDPCSTSTSTRRLKSVVVKVDKSNKKFKSQEFISSSESSDGESTIKPRLSSVVVSSGSSLTTSSSSSVTAPSGSSSGSSRRSQNTDIPTPASALDLSTGHAVNSSPFLLERMSMSRVRNQKMSRRWESDDDEVQDQDLKHDDNEDSDSTASLLSVGKIEDEERVPDSDDSDDSICLPTRARKRQRIKVDVDDDDGDDFDM